MRTTEAARYARWSALAAGVLLLIVSGVYIRRAWEARQAEKAAPPDVPPSVKQRSAGFSFSKVAGDRTVFTLRASRATEFKKGDRSLLEDVWITVYGSKGQRFDNLHTQACDYIPGTGEITCAGKVQIDLQSASDARLHPSAPGKPNPEARILHVATSHVSFSRTTGVATTTEPVVFQFPQGEGRAVGLRYDSGPGRMRLLHDVHLTLHAKGPSGAGPGVPPASATNIFGSALTYRRGEHVLHLLGPVAVRQGARDLKTNQLDLDLDANLRAWRIVATGRSEVSEAGKEGPPRISADQFSALLSGAGRIRQIVAAGNVRGDMKDSDGKKVLEADRVEEEFQGGTARPVRLLATGNVRTVSEGAEGETWRLATSRLALVFTAAEGGGTRLASAATPAAKLDWHSPPQKADGNPGQQMELKAQRLDASFGGANELRELHGMGGVEVRRQIGSAMAMTGTSRELTMRFGAKGRWAGIEQSGDVRLRQGDRTAAGSRARMDRANGRINLAGPVTLSDATSRTTARSAVYDERGKEFRAEGGVVTTETSTGADRVANFAAGPANISADRLTVDNDKGRAIYSGHGRLWQGGSVIEANVIELNRAGRTLTATGRVRGVFPEAPWAPPAGSDGSGASATPRETLRAAAGRMIYSGDQQRARLSGGVVAQTAEGSIRSDSMELVFAPEKPEGTANGAKMAVMGSQELMRAEAMGNVVVEQGNRRATAARGEYTAAQGKFVLSGGSPKLYDDSGNVVTGRQLTFFFADDRIEIDSEEGSRTLTLHRVER